MSEKETILQGYNELAETYASKQSENEREIALLNEFLDSLSEPIRILDAGCGNGTPVLRRLCEGATAIGLDFSREQLRLAAEAVPPAYLAVGDMTSLPFRDNVFNAVTTYNPLIKRKENTRA